GRPSSVAGLCEAGRGSLREPRPGSRTPATEKRPRLLVTTGAGPRKTGCGGPIPTPPNPRAPVMTVRPRPCEGCKAEIPAERIEALPETRLCVKCSEAVGGEFRMVLKKTNLGKSGSLKRRSEDIDVKFVRRKIAPLDN